jgi:hypothetical protein
LLRFLFLTLAFFLTSTPALAWSDYGHATVGRIAWLEMQPGTRARVIRLLTQSRLLDTPTCPARTLEQASIWPDCIKFLRNRFSYALPWHYQNIPICRAFDADAECPNGNCISAQIERHLRLLANEEVPARERLALAFVAHLVGDLHMPLHVADRGDRGGGQLPESYGIISGRTNLHLAWDVYLEERSISTPAGGAAGIHSELDAAEREVMRRGGLDDWMRESWALGLPLAYGTVMDDPCGVPPAGRPVITESDTQRLIPVIRRQVARGGVRLAQLLDEALA